jgi:hypothetical protein
MCDTALTRLVRASRVYRVEAGVAFSLTTITPTLVIELEVTKC